MTTHPDKVVYNYPVYTPEGWTLLNSDHKANKIKAIAAFSTSVQNFNELMKRKGYKLLWRTKGVVEYSQYIREPDCRNIPFTPIDNTSWFYELPFSGIVNDYNLNEIIEAQGLLYDGKALPIDLPT